MPTIPILTSEVKTVEIISTVNPKTLPNGEYIGLWSGRFFKCSIEGFVHTMRTHDGPRITAPGKPEPIHPNGREIPAIARIENGRIIVETLPETPKEEKPDARKIKKGG